MTKGLGPPFGPGSMTWKIDRESILLIGGPSALLMQLAHPSVAAGVADHSDFQSDGLARLRRTMDTMLTLLFGPEDDARAALARIHAIHARVEGARPDGMPYSARDPKLLLWVFATLIDSAVRVYESCVARLTDEGRDAYIRESRAVAELFGIADILPPDLPALRGWMNDMIASGEVAVGPVARALAEPILRPSRLIPRPVAAAGSLLTASFLPPEIREGYGLAYGPKRGALLSWGGRASRRVLPLVPAPLRHFPAARVALKLLRPVA